MGRTIMTTSISWDIQLTPMVIYLDAYGMLQGEVDAFHPEIQMVCAARTVLR